MPFDGLFDYVVNDFLSDGFTRSPFGSSSETSSNHHTESSQQTNANDDDRTCNQGREIDLTLFESNQNHSIDHPLKTNRRGHRTNGKQCSPRNCNYKQSGMKTDYLVDKLCGLTKSALCICLG